jgi:Fic family protein
MRYEDFAASPAGRLVPTLFGAQAFVPNPLPPSFELAPVLAKIARATGEIGELRGAARRLSNPMLLIQPMQRLEAQTSSAMEGTYTTNEDLVLAEAGVTKDTKQEAIEVANFVRALTWAVDELERLPLSGRLLKGIHQRLLQQVGSKRGQDKRPGEYKRDQNMIGGAKIELARFVPPPPDEAEKAMANLENYINRDDRNQALAVIDLALVHYQFETIHPFADGNGRVGRMLISLMAMSEGLVDGPLLYMSPEIERSKDEYIDRMYAVSAQGDWVGWIGYFLDTLSVSCRRTIRTIDRVIDLQADFLARAKAKSRSANLQDVVSMLFERPVIRPSNIVERLGITDAAARNLLRLLVEAEVLVESRRYYPALWLAPAILEVSDPDRI